MLVFPYGGSFWIAGSHGNENNRETKNLFVCFNECFTSQSTATVMLERASIVFLPNKLHHLKAKGDFIRHIAQFRVMNPHQ